LLEDDREAMGAAGLATDAWARPATELVAAWPRRPCRSMALCDWPATHLGTCAKTVAWARPRRSLAGGDVRRASRIRRAEQQRDEPSQVRNEPCFPIGV